MIIFLGISTAHAMDIEERLLFANGLYRRGLFDIAIPEYQGLLAEPSATNMHDIAAFRIAECQRSLGKTNEAAAAFDLVAENYPQSSFAVRAAFRRAEIDWSAGRLKDASKRFQQVIDQKPPADIESASLYFLGISQFGIDRYEPAEKNLRRLLNDHRDSPYADYALIALADLIIQQGGSKKEAAELLKAVADEPETPTLGAEATAKAGRLAYNDKQLEVASDWFTRLAQQHRDDTWYKQTLMEAAWSHLLSGRTGKARDAAAEGLSAASANDKPAWLYLSANIERRDQHTKKAAVLYDELLQTAPEHELAATAAFEACSMAWQDSDYERVLKLHDLASGPPEHTLSLLWMKAGSLRGLKRNDEAAIAYETIVSNFPDSDRAPASAYQLALITEEKGDVATAAKLFESVAVTHANAAIAPDALMAAASAYLRVNDVDAAASTWRNAIKQHPDYPGLDEAYMGLARAEVKREKFKPAAEALDKLLSRPDGPLTAEALYLRGTLFEKDEAYDESENYYQRALKNKPAPALARQVQYRRVAVLQRQGRNDDAADLMNKLLADGAGDQLPSPLMEWLARWNLQNNNYPAAEKAALRLAEAGDTPIWKQVGYYIAGTAALEQKKNKRAVAAFSEAAALGLNTRETADSLYQLGLIALEEKQPETALQHFSRAAEYASTDATMDIRAKSYLQLGIAHEELGQWTDAGRYYMSVGVLFDDPSLTPESLYRAAGALHAQQKDSERERVVAELRERFPDNEWTKRAGERWP